MQRLELTAEQLERVQRRKQQDKKIKVSPEELFVAEIGYYYGWDAAMAVLKNEVTMDDANVLLAGARKVWSSKLIDMASVMFTANAAAKSGKKAKQVMDKGLKNLTIEAKADL